MPAKISGYESQLTPNGQMIQPVARGQRISSAFGLAANDVAQGVNAITNVKIHELDDDAKAWAVNATSQADIAASELLEAKKRSATDGAPKFKEGVLEDWNKYQGEALKNAPNEATKRLMINHFSAVTEGLTLKSDAFADGERDRWRLKMASDGVDNDAKLINSKSDPAEMDGSLAASMGKWATYYKTQDMEPAQRQAALDATRAKLTNAAAVKLSEVNPKLLKNLGRLSQGATPQDGIINFVMHEMEGGAQVVPDGKGIAKFGINSAANKGVDVANLTEDQATAIYKEKYWDKAGISALPKNMQLAAFDTVVNHGVTKGKELIDKAGGDPYKLIELRKDEYQRLATDDPAQYAKNLQGWSNRLTNLSQGISPNPNATSSTSTMWNLGTSEQQKQWAELGDREYTAQQRAQEKALTESQAINYSDAQIAVSRNKMTYAEIEQGYSQGKFSPSQRSTLTTSLDDVIKKGTKEADSVQRVAMALKGEGTLDPKSTTDRKAVDDNYQAWQKNALATDGNVNREAMIEQINKYNILPESVRSDVRGGLRSNDPEQKIQAADLLDRLRQKNPNLINDFADEDIKDALTLQSYVQSGFSPANAANLLSDSQKLTPEIRNMRQDSYKDMVKATPVENTVRSQFTSWNPFGSQWNNSSKIPLQMQNDFNQMAQAEYVRSGNWDSANKVAASLLEKTWGPTQVVNYAKDGSDDSKGFWMKNPPEKYYAAPTQSLSASQQSEWMREQLIDDLNKSDRLSGKAVDAANVTLTVSNRTLPDGSPTYNVWIKQDGVINLYGGNDFTWHPEWDSSKERERLLRRERHRGEGGTPMIVAPGVM